MRTTVVSKPGTDDGVTVPVATQIWNAGLFDSDLWFSLRHLLFTQMIGRVSRWKATAAIDLDQPERSWIDVVVAAASFATGDAERDEHIGSIEFLEPRLHPEIRYRSTAVTAQPD